MLLNYYINVTSKEAPLEEDNGMMSALIPILPNISLTEFKFIKTFSMRKCLGIVSGAFSFSKEWKKVNSFKI